MGTIPLPLPWLNFHNAGHPPAFSFGQPEVCPFCLPPTERGFSVEDGTQARPLTALANVEGATRALHDARERLNRAIIGAHLQGHSVREIAAATDASRETVRKLVVRADRALNEVQ